MEISHSQDSHYTSKDFKISIPKIFTKYDDAFGYLDYDYEIFVVPNLEAIKFDYVSFTFVSDLTSDEARVLYYDNQL